MKALHRVLVTGTIGAMAIVTAAASGAFACTAQAGVKGINGTDPTKPYVAPGDVLSLTIDNYLPEGPGVSLVRVALVAPDKSETFITERAGPKFTFDWTVPSTIPTSTSRYAVVATQTQHGALHRPEGMLLFIATGTKAPPQAPPPTLPQQAVSPPASLVPVPPKEEGPPSVAMPINQGIGSAKDMTPSFTSSPPASPAGAVVDPVSGAVVGAPTAAINPAELPPQDRQAPALATVAQAPAESLWSGLDGEDGAASPNLLDVASPSGRSGPLGGILLAGGATLLALAGLALGVSRRRLALVRR